MAHQLQTIIERMLAPLLAREQFELVDVEYVKEGSNWFLRVFVDKEGGIDIEDCSRISEFLSERLDEEDPIPNAYFLEVSSPGAERPLKKTQDFYKAVGKDVFISTYEPIGGAKEFEGKLTAYDEKTLVVQHGNKQTEIPAEKVASARLAILF
jgi:ribosome maturation factor RimP